jgi:hypothetical protein
MGQIRQASLDETMVLAIGLAPLPGAAHLEITYQGWLAVRSLTPG